MIPYVLSPEFDALKAKILTRVFTADNCLHALKAQLPLIAEPVCAAGVVVIMDDQQISWGKTPPPAFIGRLKNWLSAWKEEIFCTDKLIDYFPCEPFIQTAGSILSTRLTGSADNIIIWFRPEPPEPIYWRGAVAEEVVKVKNDSVPEPAFVGCRLNNSHRAVTWEPAEIAAANSLNTGLAEILIGYADDTFADEQDPAGASIKEKTQEINKLYDDLLKKNVCIKAVYDQRTDIMRQSLADILSVIPVMNEALKQYPDKNVAELVMRLDKSATKLDRVIREIAVTGLIV